MSRIHNKRFSVGGINGDANRGETNRTRIRESGRRRQRQSHRGCYVWIKEAVQHLTGIMSASVSRTSECGAGGTRIPFVFMDTVRRRETVDLSSFVPECVWKRGFYLYPAANN